MPTATGFLAWGFALQALTAPTPATELAPPPSQHVWADLDGDGLDELFVALPGGERLFHNRGDGELRSVLLDAPPASGPVAGALAADFDRDGRAELLLLGADGTLRLLRCAGALADGLRDEGAALGLDGLAGVRGAIRGIATVDVEDDGWLDLLVSTDGAHAVVPNRAGRGFGPPVELAVRASAALPSAGPEVAGTPPAGPATDSGGVAAPFPKRDGRPSPLGPRGGDGGGTDGPPGPAGPTQPQWNGGMPQAVCGSLLDVTTQVCVSASSVAMLGALYPLSEDFNVDPGTGFVGIGTTSPVEGLHVRGGSMRVDGGMDVYKDGTLSFDIAPATSTGSELRIFNDQGQLCFELDSDHSGGGDGFMTLGNGAGLTEQVFVDGGVNDQGGEIGLKNDAGVRTVWLDGQDGTGGGLRVYDDTGAQTLHASGQGGSVSVSDGATFGVLMDGFEGDGGGSLRVYPDAGSHTIFLDGEGSGGGGLVQLFTQNAQNATAETLRLQGDDGLDGRIELLDANGVPPQVTVLMRGHDSFSTGSELQINSSGASSTTTIDIDSQNGTVSEFRINETDGSAAFWMIGSTFTLRDASGAITQSYDRMTGAKSAVVGTESHGRRHLYAVESPEVWLEDQGAGRLRGGVARVELDPVFLETVTVDGRWPLRVFVTPAGETPGLYVEKGRRGFVVRELPGGPGDAAFDWRVVAKRRGLETARLERWAEPSADELAPATTAPSTNPVTTDPEETQER